MLALPKLNLQFLTLGDYLLRNFNLFRLEATYEIREDLSDVLKRIKPFIGDDEQARGRAGRARGGGGVGWGAEGARVVNQRLFSRARLQVGFGGWARMAQPVTKFAIVGECRQCFAPCMPVVV